MKDSRAWERGLFSILLAALIPVAWVAPAAATGLDHRAADVVTLVCDLRGSELVVRSVSPRHASRTRLHPAKEDCAGRLSELLGSGMQLIATTEVRSSAIYTLMSPLLGPDELSVGFGGETAACACDDAIPISGFECESCTFRETTTGGIGCFCLFKKKLSTP